MATMMVSEHAACPPWPVDIMAMDNAVVEAAAYAMFGVPHQEEAAVRAESEPAVEKKPLLARFAFAYEPPHPALPANSRSASRRQRDW
ncbi:Anhydro-N-acetylmuramic acid kinase [Frankliniella fusca]|uniref:Anhydro-N-acetylmuramic acid kinase n=1 Tax=Frankliniella fusca TaxID=407009 RepID=A0AAE1HXF0_9NEOP|nr:Anhydro-N-acetylmuramic acid kinase [Frankliniella fusca]